MRQADGRWNVAALVPLPKFSDDTPEMFIEDATLILEDATRHAVAPLSLRGIDIKLTPGELASASGQLGSRPLVVTGTATGAPARELTFTGTISPRRRHARPADRNPRPRSLPRAARRHPRPAACTAAPPSSSTPAPTRPSASAPHQPGGAPLVWSADVSLTRGRLDYELLPQPLTELAAKIHADSEKLVVKQL